MNDDKDMEKTRNTCILQSEDYRRLKTARDAAPDQLDDSTSASSKPRKGGKEPGVTFLHTTSQTEGADKPDAAVADSPSQARLTRQRCPLINRRASPDLGVFELGSRGLSFGLWIT
jgi:hypothetical protein